MGDLINKFILIVDISAKKRLAFIMNYLFLILIKPLSTDKDHGKKRFY